MAAVVAAGTFLACRWALKVDNWRVMTDELLYLKMADSIVDTLSPRPTFRGVELSNYSVLYPALLAPLVGWLDVSTAFRVAHGLGALLLASTSVPTYLLARYVSRSRAVAVAAALPVAVMPWLLYSLNLMTEVLAAPLLVWTIYAYVRALAEPSPRRDAIALVAVALLVLARTQFLFMPAVLVAAILVHELGWRLSGRSPRQWLAQIGGGLKAATVGHPLIVALTVLGVVLLVVMSASAFVGDYSVVVSSAELLPPGFVDALYRHVTLVAFGVAGVPLVLALAFVGDALWRPEDRRRHALAACLLVAIPLIVLVATNFDLRFSAPLQERYVFYMAPLLLVGAACFVHGTRRPLAAVAGGAAVAVFVIASTPDLLTLEATSVFASPARQGWVPFDGYVYRFGTAAGIGDVSPFLVLATGTALASLGLAWLVRSGRRGVALTALGCGIAVWCGALTSYAGPKVLAEHEALATVGLAGSIPLEQRSWIDDAVGSGATVGLAPTLIASRGGAPIAEGAVTTPSVWWEAEFWNRSVGRSYIHSGSQDWTPYAQQAMKLRPGSSQLRVSGAQAPYLVVANGNVRFAPAGTVVARTRDLRLIRAKRPYRVAWATSGITELGQLPPGGPAVLSVYGRDSGPSRRAQVSLLVVGQTLERPLTVRAAGSGRRMRVFGRRRIERSLCVRARGAEKVSLGVGGPNKLRLIAVRVRMGGPC